LREPQLERVADGIDTLRLGAHAIGDARVEPARVTLVSGPRGVVVVDSGLSARDGEAILAAAARLSDAPVRLLVLTHPSQEAIFGASAFAARGIPIAMSREAARLMASRCGACLERLRAALGDEAMAETRLVAPQRLLEDGEILGETGRELRVIAPATSSAPGAVALEDIASGTIIAGSIALVHAIPDLRDADLASWHATLERIEARGCPRLVPAFGPIGSCADAAALRRYLEQLEMRVRMLRDGGVELGDLDARAGLAEFRWWDRYDELHSANAARLYLRLERDDLAKP